MEWWRIRRWLIGRRLDPSRFGVTRSEALAIIAAIRATPGLDTRVLHLYRNGPDEVEVTVGELGSPMSGAGDIITARRVRGVWHCEKTAEWES